MTVTDLEIGSDRQTPVVKGGGRPKRRARLLPGGLRWILPAFAISVGLIYYSIIYSGYLSFFSWPGGRALMTPVGFGNYISIPSALRIGLIPPLPLERVRYVGNAAALGAQLALVSEAERARAEAIAGRIEHVSLAAHPDFETIFVDCMNFPRVA